MSTSLLPKNLLWSLAQDRWAALLNPLLSNPISNASVLPNIALVVGTNSIPHLLGAKLQGWSIVRRRQFKVAGTPTAYDIYDTQDSNQMPAKTLQLVCSEGTQANPVLVDLVVF